MQQLVLLVPAPQLLLPGQLLPLPDLLLHAAGCGSLPDLRAGDRDGSSANLLVSRHPGSGLLSLNRRGKKDEGKRIGRHELILLPSPFLHLWGFRVSLRMRGETAKYYPVRGSPPFLLIAEDQARSNQQKAWGFQAGTERLSLQISKNGGEPEKEYER